MIAGEKLKQFSARHQANVLWAFAKLGHHPGALLGALTEEMGGKLQDFNAQNLANTLWALATLGELPVSSLHSAASTCHHAL
jgi:hypothetical protein